MASLLTQLKISILLFQVLHIRYVFKNRLALSRLNIHVKMPLDRQ
jgi:hypothetical protein